MLGRLAAGVVLAATAAACSSSGSTAQLPAPGAVSDSLSRVAATAASASYSATYTFFEAADGQTAQVSVWRSPPSLRVDVVARGTTASLIAGGDATYSCSQSGSQKSCLLVAKAGEPLPAPFNVAPANLFTVDVRQLATHTADYEVDAATPPTAGANAPLTMTGVSCYAVSPRPTAAAPQVPKGTYCFFGNGVLASARYPSGNTITLQSQQASAPPASQFTPYAKPTPLPS